MEFIAIQVQLENANQKINSLECEIIELKEKLIGLAQACRDLYPKEKGHEQLNPIHVAKMGDNILDSIKESE